MMAGFLSRLMGIPREAKAPEQEPDGYSGKNCFQRNMCPTCTSSAPERCSIAEVHTLGKKFANPAWYDWTGNIVDRDFHG